MSAANETPRYPYAEHDNGIVLTQPRNGEFERKPMTLAQLLARDPALAIAKDIYRHAIRAGICYYDFWELISKAIQDGIERTAADALGSIGVDETQANQASPSAAANETPRGWRCFHCGEVFTEAEDARIHFGATLASDPACQINAEQVREMEDTLARFREEDTDLHREIYRLKSDHQIALRREEEAGYAKGLKDGMAELAAERVKHKADLELVLKNYDADVKDLEGRLALQEEMLRIQRDNGQSWHKRAESAEARLAGLEKQFDDAGVLLHYSRDSGVTWLKYSIEDRVKLAVASYCDESDEQRADEAESRLKEALEARWALTAAMEDAAMDAARFQYGHGVTRSSIVAIHRAMLAIATQEAG